MIHKLASELLGLDTSKFGTLTVKSTKQFLILRGKYPNGAQATFRFYEEQGVYQTLLRNSFSKGVRNAHIVELSQFLSCLELADLFMLSDSAIRVITKGQTCKTAQP